MKVWILHRDVTPSESYVVGVFSTEKKAKDVMAQLRKRCPHDSPEDWLIDDWIVDDEIEGVN